MIPDDSLERLEQEFLKEEVDFAPKPIFLTLTPSGTYDPAEVLAVAVGR